MTSKKLVSKKVGSLRGGESEEFDFVVIGGGSAGYAAARTAVGLGLKTAVVEGARVMGGLCILRGCMPTKALLESAHRVHEAKRAREFGFKTGKVEASLRAIVKRKDALIAEFAAYRQEQLQAGKFTLVRGNARFIDRHTLAVEGASGGMQVRARSFLIATGSQIASVPVPGLEETGYLTSDTALDLVRLPERMAVLGGGAIACELAQYFHHLGTRVTLVQRSARLIKEFDPELSETLAVSLREEGMAVETGTQLLSVRQTKRGKEVRFLQGEKERRVVVDEILYALGRRPAIDGLDLPAAGVTVEHGAVVVDAAMQSSVPHIFAAGDVTGLYEVVHTAIAQGETAAHNAAVLVQGKEAKARRLMDYRLKTTVIFTSPEVAQVGMNEVEARAAGLDILTASYPFNDHGKSMIMGARHGFVKLVAARETGLILGASVVGPHASDLIHELVAVMHFSGTVQDVVAMPHYHPTLAEIWSYPAEEIAEQVAA